MWTWLAVAAGGAIGSMARHGVNRIVMDGWPALRFPLATLIVNVVGSCVFGVLAGLIASNRLEMRAHWREFVFVGLLGGFTTFSTFAGDVVTLARGGFQTHAAVNVLLQVVLSIAGLYLGLTMAARPS
jgi:CrcB protein